MLCGVVFYIPTGWTLMEANSCSYGDDEHYLGYCGLSQENSYC